MSGVKRYSFWPQIVHLPGGGGVRAEVHFKVEEDGLFVAHQDYASLKAEVERLKNNCDYLDRELDREIDKTAMLCGQVERLIKAGDDFYESEIGYYGEQILENMKHHSGELCRNWNAAKEGKQP